MSTFREMIRRKMKGEYIEMKSIYASKLFISSKRKDRITAALVNASNAELVQQLASSLDEEYQRPDLLVEPDQGSSNEGEVDNGGGPLDNDLPESFSPSGGGGAGLSSFDPDSDLVDFPEEGEFSEEGEVPSEGGEGEIEDVSDESVQDVQEEPVEESTRVNASTDVASKIADNLTALKDGLNSVDSTAGTNRIVIKDNEVWIYYNDDVNLNSIMTDVIEYVAKVCEELEFNRLARSDNAIVFEICCKVV